MTDNIPHVPPLEASEDPSDWWATPGTQRAREIEQAEAKRDFGENVQAGFEDTALSTISTLVEEEGSLLAEETSVGGATDPLTAVTNTLTNAGIHGMGVLGWRAGEAEDYSDDYEKLTTGIPHKYWSDILDEPNREAAQRARARVVSQLDRARQSALQQGITPNLAMMVGGVIDVDAPLMLATGGGYGAARLAGRTLRAAKSAHLPPRAALRLSSAAVGGSAGLQAGAVTGLAEATFRETADWTTVADAMLQNMFLGAAGNVALRGDWQLSAQAARDELYKRMATDDPSMHAGPMPDGQPNRVFADDHIEPVEVADGVEVADSTVGAQQVNPLPGVQPVQGVNVSPEAKDINVMTSNWRHDSDWQDQKIAADDEWWTRVALSGAANFSTGNFRKLYTSDSSTLNWMLGNVFESPNGLGRGRVTAATLMETYHRRIAGEFSQILQTSASAWAKRNGKMAAGVVPTQQGVREFNRMVALELNERRMGRTTANPDPDVKSAADALDKTAQRSLNIGRGERGELAVDGFEDIDPQAGYSPYIWDGGAVNRLLRDGVVDHKQLVDAMALAYQNAGISATKDARLVADAVIKRATARADDVNTNLLGLLSGDGREWLEQALDSSGMPANERAALMKRLTGEVEERGRESFTKKRNDIDLNTSIPTKDGSDLRVVDLMNPDLHATWQRYTRRLAGSAALARVGITNRAQREQFIAAAQGQQRELGEDVVDADMLRAMFSHFDGGAVHGYSNFLGRTYEEGIMPEAAMVKRMTNLALLGKLGLAQLAETGAGIAATGLENWMRRGPLGALNKELREGNKELLDDLAFILGDLGQDHHLFAEWLDLDDMNATDRGWFLNGAQRLSQRGSYLQGFVSGFNQVRGFQQRIVTGAMTDKIFRAIKKEIDAGNSYITDEKFRKRMQTDLGLMDEDFTKLFDLVSDGTVEFTSRNGKEYVNRVNADLWDVDIRNVFGASLTRNMNQVVQRSMAGEQDTWMNTTVASLLTHLKTFPMQAVQKQFLRNVRHTDGQTLNTLLFGMATATAAIMIRDAIDGKDRSAMETAKLAFGYSNLTGWVPMVTDPAATMLGMEDLRFNQYGPHNEYTPATMTWLNRASRLPGAAADALTGNADYHDWQSLRALPFYNIAGAARFTN